MFWFLVVGSHGSWRDGLGRWPSTQWKIILVPRPLPRNLTSLGIKTQTEDCSYCLHAEEVLQTVDWQGWRIHKLILTKSCQTTFKKLTKMVLRHRQWWREASLRELDSNTQEGIAKKRLDEQNNPYVRVFTCCSCPLQNNAICPNFEYLMQNFEPCSLGWINM